MGSVPNGQMGWFVFSQRPTIVDLTYTLDKPLGTLRNACDSS